MKIGSLVQGVRAVRRGGSHMDKWKTFTVCGQMMTSVRSGWCKTKGDATRAAAETKALVDVGREVITATRSDSLTAKLVAAKPQIATRRNTGDSDDEEDRHTTNLDSRERIETASCFNEA